MLTLVSSDSYLRLSTLNGNVSSKLRNSDRIKDANTRKKTWNAGMWIFVARATHSPFLKKFENAILKF
jgi:hypothetical protein